MNRSLSALALIGVAVVAGSSRAHAQVKLEGTVFFSAYYSTDHLRHVDKDNLERQQAGPGLGAALTWRFNNIWAVEAQGVYVLSGVDVKNTDFVNFEPPTAGTLLLGNGRLLFQPRRTNIYFSAGAGMISRKGEAWDVNGIEETNSVAGIVGFGVRARVNPQWGFKLGAELHLYKTDPDGTAGTYYDSRMQKDVFVTIGVPFALIGR